MSDHPQDTERELLYNELASLRDQLASMTAARDEAVAEKEKALRHLELTTLMLKTSEHDYKNQLHQDEMEIDALTESCEGLRQALATETEAVPATGEKQYYLLSHKHSPAGDMARFWGKDFKGYTVALEYAGKYTAEQLKSLPDGSDQTQWVEVEFADSMAMKYVDYAKLKHELSIGGLVVTMPAELRKARGLDKEEG